MSNLQANKTIVENEARGIASLINMVIRSKVPVELTEKYLEVLLCSCSYSVAISQKVAKNTRDIVNSCQLSTNGSITAASVYKTFFILKKVFKGLRNIVRAYDSYESRDRLIEELRTLRRMVRSAYL